MAATRHDTHDVPMIGRLARILLFVAGMCAAVAVGVAIVAVSVPSDHRPSSSDVVAAQNAQAARRAAANARWASATCTDILAWRDEVKRDAANLSLSLGALTRVKDAASATKRLLAQLDRIGPPPSAQGWTARADARRFQSDLTSRMRSIEDAAVSVATGNLAAIGPLIGDLSVRAFLQDQVAAELRHVVTVDLGVSLVRAPACRQLVGVSA